MERLASSKSKPILSAFVRPSLRGRLYVEAKSPLDVRRGCSGLSGVIFDKLSHVPIDEALSLLQLDTHFFSVAVGDWVRVKSGLYRQDLAIVLEACRRGTDVRVAVIPRLDLAPDSGGKRQCSCQSRPAKRLFDKEEVVRAFGEELVTQCNQVFMFRKQEFKNGLLELCLDLRDLVQELAIPTSSELLEFSRSPTLDLRLVERAFIRKSRSSLKSEDRVKVVAGERKGEIGIVKNVRGSMATLCIQGDLNLEIPTSSIVKFFKLHDYVKVREGLETGRCGWVTSCTPPHITIFDREKSRQVWCSQCTRHAPDCNAPTAYCHVLGSRLC
jgi:transcription elongation factor SPT5